MEIAKDFPKLECPFERGDKDGVWTTLPIIKPQFKWIFTDDCIASDKLDGTNVSIVIREGKIIKILNRSNVIDIWKSGYWFYEGIRTAIENKYINPELLEDGQYFGELIGPKLQGNPYQLTQHRWVPFYYLEQKYEYKFWKEFSQECKDLDDEQIFNKVSDLFKGLWSIYKRQLGITGEVTESTKFEGLAAEGIVFLNKKTGERCKLRRDMFSWFTGGRHNE